MEIIHARVAMHHNRQRVLLIFDYDPGLVGKIKELPNHKNENPDIYTHIINKGLKKIKSPLDYLEI